MLLRAAAKCLGIWAFRDHGFRDLAFRDLGI